MKKYLFSILLLTVFICQGCFKKLEELEAAKASVRATVDGQPFEATDFIELKSFNDYLTYNSDGYYNYRLFAANLSSNKIIALYFDNLAPGTYTLKEKHTNRNYGVGTYGSFDHANDPLANPSFYYKTNDYSYYGYNQTYDASGELKITQNKDDRISGTFYFKAWRYTNTYPNFTTYVAPVQVTQGSFENVYLSK